MPHLMIKPDKAIAETEKAYLIEFEDGYKKWFPKKAIYSPMYPETKEHGTIAIRDWFIDYLTKEEYKILKNHWTKVEQDPKFTMKPRSRSNNRLTASQDAQLECFGHSGMDGGWGNCI